MYFGVIELYEEMEEMFLSISSMLFYFGVESIC